MHSWNTLHCGKNFWPRHYRRETFLTQTDHISAIVFTLIGGHRISIVSRPWTCPHYIANGQCRVTSNCQSRPWWREQNSLHGWLTTLWAPSNWHTHMHNNQEQISGASPCKSIYFPRPAFRPAGFSLPPWHTSFSQHSWMFAKLCAVNRPNQFVEPLSCIDGKILCKSNLQE